MEANNKYTISSKINTNLIIIITPYYYVIIKIISTRVTNSSPRTKTKTCTI